MAKGYWIAHADLHDPETYKLYVESSPAAFEKYNAKVLARAGAHVQLEGAGKARNVVLEFDSYDDAVACYNSEEYQTARKFRAEAGDADIVIVEGV